MRTALAAVVCSVVVAGCDTVCPAEFDATANRGGHACMESSDCRVECVCLEGEDDEVGIYAGSCIDDVCVDSNLSCEQACAPRLYAGEYCETRSD